MRLVNASDDDYLQDVLTLYAHTFPKEEQIETSDLLTMANNGTCQIYAILDQVRFIGLSITFHCEGYTYLAYFAIHPKYRNQGYGSQALTLLKDYDSKLLLEIETTYLPNSRNFQQRLNRKKFYLKNKLKASNFTVNCYGVTMEIMSTIDHYRYHDYVALYEHLVGEEETRKNIALDTILLS